MVAEDVLDERGVEVRKPAASELLGPREADPARPAELAGHVARVAVGEEALPPPFRVGFEQRPKLLAERSRLLAERHLLGGQPKVHDRS